MKQVLLTPFERWLVSTRVWKAFQGFCAIEVKFNFGWKKNVGLVHVWTPYAFGCGISLHFIIKRDQWAWGREYDAYMDWFGIGPLFQVCWAYV